MSQRLAVGSRRFAVMVSETQELTRDTMLTLFFIAAAVAIVATVLAITRINAVHALLYLIVSLLSVAVVFYTLGAPFVAALEVIIYAGAIVVLFLFVVMMLNVSPQSLEQESRWLTPRTWIGPGLLAAVLLAELIYMLTRQGELARGTEVVGPKEVGAALFGPYVIGAELASFLLLAGLVGAYHLGRRSEPGSRRGEAAS